MGYDYEIFHRHLLQFPNLYSIGDEDNHIFYIYRIKI